MLERLADRPNRPAAAPAPSRPSSALRASLLQRLAVVAAPVAALWLAVALALDVFR